MSGNNVDASRAVASLLREEAVRSDGDSLRSLSNRVQAFLNTAHTQPAQPLEAVEPSGSEPVVELAVVAGVLEEKGGLTGEVDSADSVLLPTVRTQESLKQRRLQEAQAMLNLMEALSIGAPQSGAAVATGTDHTVNTNAATSSDDDEVVFMAAEDLENEESTDGEEDNASPAAKRRLIEEMN